MLQIMVNTQSAHINHHNILSHAVTWLAGSSLVISFPDQEIRVWKLQQERDMGTRLGCMVPLINSVKVTILYQVCQCSLGELLVYDMYF